MSNHEEKTVKIINKAGPAGFTFFLMYIGAAITLSTNHLVDSGR